MRVWGLRSTKSTGDGMRRVTQQHQPRTQQQVEELTNEQRGALLALPRDLSDAPTFSRAVNDFLADIQYARMMNAAAANG